MEHEILNSLEAARLLRIGKDNLCRLAANGLIPSARAGKEWRFSRTALMAWVSTPQQRTKATDDLSDFDVTVEHGAVAVVRKEVSNV